MTSFEFFARERWSDAGKKGGKTKLTNCGFVGLHYYANKKFTQNFKRRYVALLH